MISIIITSFNEPKTIKKAIDSFVNQKIKSDYELYVAAPDEETWGIVEEYGKNRKIKLFKDPGKGKSYAINLLLPKLKGEILFFSDGDVFVSENSVNEMMEFFEDEKVGAVTGRVVSKDSKNTMLGYWGHLLCDAGAHYLRKKRNDSGKFVECSGYLWAFRNGLLKKFPIDVAEDTIVPLILWNKGFKIKYSEDAKVFVSFPTNLSDFIEQKKRTIKSHEKIENYGDKRRFPKMKSFGNEVGGMFNILKYPNNFKEFFYTIYLFPFRLYIWGLAVYLRKIKKTTYQDAWKRVESTK